MLLPIAACFLKAGTLSFDEFWARGVDRAGARGLLLTFGAAFIAAVVNLVLGLLIAWVLVRYEFPRQEAHRFARRSAARAADRGRRPGLLEPVREEGWLGQYLVPLGIKGAYTRLGIVLVLIFVGLPFVVRTVQPVLEDLDPEAEEASASLGATRWQTFRARDPADALPGADHRLRAGVRARRRRVRLGRLHLAATCRTRRRSRRS